MPQTIVGQAGMGCGEGNVPHKIKRCVPVVVGMGLVVKRAGGFAAVLTNLKQWWIIIYYVHNTDKNWHNGKVTGSSWQCQEYCGAVGMRLAAQLVELDLTTEQLDIFHRHSEARRIARNDLIAEFKARKARDEKVVLKTLRPWFNAIKDRKHAWMRSCSQNAVKGGLIDAVDALQRFFKGQNKFPKFEPKGKHCRFSY